MSPTLLFYIPIEKRQLQGPEKAHIIKMRNTLWRFTAILLLGAISSGTQAKNIVFDYSQQAVPEESGIRFEKITDDADYVNDNGLVGRNAGSWWVGPQLALSPDGSRIAYINNRNKMQNIMVKPTTRGGASIQRTQRVNVKDVTWSEDGKMLCFTEYRNGHYGIYLTNADQGSIVRQINNGNDNDFSGVLVNNGNTVLFHRQEGRGNYGLWEYDFKTNIFSNFSRGMTPVSIPGEKSTIYCTRMTNNGQGEIWKINYVTGNEELILSHPDKSFSTPQLSPDGKWIICTGSSVSELTQKQNTDIYAIRVTGTQLTQLTFHPGNDLSPVWSPDGHSIYFLSQRGSAERYYNVWKMDFNL